MNKDNVLENGFLDNKLNIEVNKNRKQFRDAYELVNKFNILMYEIEKNFKKDNGRNRDVYIYTVFNQIHISCQTYIILIERGMYLDAQIILRAIYEKILNLKMVIKDEKYLNRILKESLNQGLSSLNKIKKNKIFELLPENIVDKRIEEYKNAIKKMKDVKLPMNLSDVADRVDMQTQYIYYKLLSEYAHNDLSALMQGLIFKDEGIIINGAQRYENFLEEILKFIECSEYSIRAICEYLSETKYIIDMQKIQLEYEYLFKQN